MIFKSPLPARIAVTAIVLGLPLLLLPPSPHADDDDAVDSPRSRERTTDFEMAAIKTGFAKATRQAPEIMSHAAVIDVSTLLNQRQQYLSSLAQADGVAAKFRESELSLQRTRNLHAQDIVASRRLQEQQAIWQADRALVSEAHLQTQAMAANMRLQWGETLSQWFLHPDDRRIADFLRGKHRLLDVVLPNEITGERIPSNLFVDLQGQRRQAIAAKLIAPAPLADPITLRRRAFYQVEAANLPVGSQLTAWIPLDSESADAVAIPESALIWHLGQAYVFVKTADGHFERRPLSEPTPIGNGLLRTSGLHDGDEIVVTGAQTLLSQELKQSIPSEDDD